MKPARNLANLLILIGLWFSKMNSDCLPMWLTILNSKECENFSKILSKIMRKTIHWSEKKITSGNWQTSLQKRRLSESISWKLKVKRLNLVRTLECWKWFYILIELFKWIDYLHEMSQKLNWQKALIQESSSRCARDTTYPET